MLNNALSFKARAARRYASRKLRVAARSLLVVSLAGGLAIAVAQPSAAADTATIPLAEGTLTTSAGSTTGTGTDVENVGGTATVTVHLPAVIVDDGRRLASGASGWSAQASFSAFTAGTTPTSMTYNAGQPSYGSGVTGGTVTSAATLITGQSGAVFSLSGFSGRSITTWNPTISAVMPASALSGTYSAVITLSVS